MWKWQVKISDRLQIQWKVPLKKNQSQTNNKLIVRLLSDRTNLNYTHKCIFNKSVRSLQERLQINKLDLEVQPVCPLQEEANDMQMEDKVDQDLEDELRQMKYLMCLSSPSEMPTNSRLHRVNSKIQFSSNNNPHLKEGSKLVLPGKTNCNSLTILTTINFAPSNKWLSDCKLQIKILMLSFTSHEEQFLISSLNHSRDKSLKLVCEEHSKWRKRDREWLKMQLGHKKLKPLWNRMLERGEWSNKKSCSKTSKRVI